MEEEEFQNELNKYRIVRPKDFHRVQWKTKVVFNG
jgi:hypothetical protein